MLLIAITVRVLTAVLMLITGLIRRAKGSPRSELEILL